MVERRLVDVGRSWKPWAKEALEDVESSELRVKRREEYF
jgi:hypothetical protein